MYRNAWPHEATSESTCVIVPKSTRIAAGAQQRLERDTGTSADSRLP